MDNLNFTSNIDRYVELLLKIGLNFQEGQRLFVRAPIDARVLVEKIVEMAYDLGAYDVYVKWSDEKVTRQRLKKAPEEALKEVYSWEIDAAKDMLDKKAAFLSITGGDPDILKDVPTERISIATKAINNAMKEVSRRVMSNEVSWCVIANPTEAWAKKVFPGDNKALDKLWEYILKASRVEGIDDPIKEWYQHIEKLQNVTEFLNKMQFDYLHYEGPGTDLTVGLPEEHLWISGAQTNKDGIVFVPNIPTEEVFTAPHRDLINGVVKNSKPLVYAGNVIDNFELEFKDGKVVRFKAEKGEKILKTILETDEGASYLGEVALVPVNSPIYKMNTVFYNTLFDENAASHFAFGRAYPTCLKNSERFSEEELRKRGLNISITHVDFMIGNENMRVTGYKDDAPTVIMENGLWVI
ncbi:aminopeptidase [Thermosipho ferrireducens]|uniref:Aminopeptidase n=1 Tax=Thermosipho ferrireducens TaxID=2571116 RepID=A0ABX7S7U3_9BACT|nr:aminopeptidase [Thermosipho ferrireducens]QTA37351.1 aminopeptidase [Thermosipho ferrireducens]